MVACQARGIGPAAYPASRGRAIEGLPSYTLRRLAVAAGGEEPSASQLVGAG
jgi:hypothetical protein